MSRSPSGNNGRRRGAKDPGLGRRAAALHLVGQGRAGRVLLPMLVMGAETHYIIAVWTYGRLELQSQMMASKPLFSDLALSPRASRPPESGRVRPPFSPTGPAGGTSRAARGAGVTFTSLTS